LAGIANGNYGNPSPEGPVAAHIYSGSNGRIMRSPTPDPGEEYAHVNTQLFGTVDPPGNAQATDVKPTTFGEAYEMLQRLGKGLFAP
jgi:hypothetical protein